jgi:hypothetical protein
LIEVKRLREILKPVRSEIEDIARNELACAARQENLSAVSRSGDARGAMNIDSHVLAVPLIGMASVHADANPDRAVVKFFLDPQRTLYGIDRTREYEEEPVTSTVDLMPALAGQGLPYQLLRSDELAFPVDRCVLEERSRPHHVGEQEGQGSGEKFRHVLHLLTPARR